MSRKIVFKNVLTVSAIVLLAGCARQTSRPIHDLAPSTTSKPTESHPTPKPNAPDRSKKPVAKKLSFTVENGEPIFSVVSGVKDDLIWDVNFLINSADVVPDRMVYSVAWRLWDSRLQSAITDWEIAEQHSRAVVYVGDMGWDWKISDPQVVKIAAHDASDLRLELSINGDLRHIEVTHYIDLGEYCGTSPTHFRSIDDDRTSCAIK